MQQKNLLLEDCQIKFAADKPLRFSGYASVFGGVDSYNDSILKGAYAETLSKSRRGALPMLMSHRTMMVIGKWPVMQEDGKGLYVEGELTPGHTEAQNAAASLKHGTLSGLSIGYSVPDDGQEITPNGIRLLKKIDLHEISLVCMPADDAARVDLDSVKSALSELKTIRDLEQYLRDAGDFSKSAAAALLSHIKSVCQGEPGELAEQKRLVGELTARVIDLEAKVLRAQFPIPTSLGVSS